jgi:hypothetical protein
MENEYFSDCHDEKTPELVVFRKEQRDCGLRLSKACTSGAVRSCRNPNIKPLEYRGHGKIILVCIFPPFYEPAMLIAHLRAISLTWRSLEDWAGLMKHWSYSAAVRSANTPNSYLSTICDASNFLCFDIGHVV